MKKGFFAFLAILTVFAMVMTGCDNGSSPKPAPTNTVTITFNGNSNTGGTPPTAQTVDKNTEITLPGAGNLVKTGSVFGGWNTAAAGTGTNYAAGAKYTAAADATLYAKWTVTGGAATVTFNGNGNTGGTAPTAQTSTVGGKITLPAAGTLVKTDNTFGGWNTAANGSGTTYAAGAEFTVTEAAVTLYAVWSATGSAATVTFNGNGNTGGTAPANITLTVGGKITLPAAGTLVKTGSTFGGWSTDPNATSGQAAGAEFTVNAASVNLYAVWTVTGGTTSIVITKVVNLPAGYTGTAPTPPDPVTLTAAGSLSAAQLTLLVAADGDLVSTGWFDAATGGNRVTTSTNFTESKSIYAQWEAVDLDTQVVITFDLNYDVTPKTFTVVFDKDAAGGDKWPGDPEREDYTFAGWWTYSTGAGNKYTSDTVLPGAQIIDNKLYAKWESQSTAGEEPPDGFDLEGAEKVNLENAWYVVYKFELPAGGVWEDYIGISADYAVPPSVWDGADGKRLRGSRLYGNYLASDFTPHSYALSTGSVMSTRAVAGFNDSSSKNAAYIFDDIGAGGAGDDAGGVGKNASKLGITATGPWQWFTVNYKIDGSRKNSGFAASNEPALDAEGPFFFGLGLPGQGGGGNTSYIRNVTLIGDTGIENVVATPLWFDIDGVLYPSFAGYNQEDGTNGSKEAYRGMVDGSQPTPVIIKTKAASNIVGWDYVGDLYWNKYEPFVDGSRTCPLNGFDLSALETGSILRVYIQNNSGANRNGWGIGTFAGKNVTGKSGTSFYVDFVIDTAIITASATGSLAVNMWSACVIIGVEVWEKGPPLTWTAVDMILGDEVDAADPPEGKNFARPIEAADVAEILAAKEGSYLRIYANTDNYQTSQTSITGWGFGSVSAEIGGDGGIGLNAKGRGDYTYDVDLWELWAKYPDGRPATLYVNYWDGAEVEIEFELYELD